MVHRRGQGPPPGVQQQPRPRENPLSTTAGPGLPPGPSEPAVAVNPGVGIVVRRNHTPAASEERLAPGAPRCPLQAPSAVRYVSASPECARPPEEPPEGELSEEELQVADEARGRSRKQSLKDK
ncbi:hypothetical protein ACSSS7_004195 [Eimeria intestinalis]